jgi:AraC family transcriptional regulator
MKNTTKVQEFWTRFADNLHAGQSALRLQLSQLASFSFGRMQSEGLPEISREGGGPRDYLVVLQLKAIPSIEQFLGKRRVSHGAYPVGGVSVLSLAEIPKVFTPHPFDALGLYVSQAALDEIAHSLRVPRVDRLKGKFGQLDSVVHHLGETLVSSLEQPDRTSQLFLDHVLHALNCHFVSSYGGVRVSPPPTGGGLSAFQMRRATEFLEANLDGSINLRQVAEICDLSLSHFARAFKQTFHKPPYQWLLERRIEKARDLLLDSRLHLADIAFQCGFTDQSGFNRSFKKIYGTTPGGWRRTTISGRGWKSTSWPVESEELSSSEGLVPL